MIALKPILDDLRERASSEEAAALAQRDPIDQAWHGGTAAGIEIAIKRIEGAGMESSRSSRFDLPQVAQDGPFVIRKAEAIEPFLLRLRYLDYQAITVSVFPTGGQERDFRLDVVAIHPGRSFRGYASGDDPNSVLDQIEEDLIAKGFEFEGSRAFLLRAAEHET